MRSLFSFHLDILESKSANQGILMPLDRELVEELKDRHADGTWIAVLDGQDICNARSFDALDMALEKMIEQGELPFRQRSRVQPILLDDEVDHEDWIEIST